MRPKFVKVVNNPDASFHAARFTGAHFFVPWHFHPELELNYIVQSTGTRFVGNNIKRFAPGELTLVGAGLPHLWKSDADYYQPGSKKLVDTMVIRFSPDNIGLDRKDIPETAEILKLIHIAKRGMSFHGPVRKIIARHMSDLLQETGMQRYLILLTILDILSRCNQYTLLSGEGFMIAARMEDARRINTVCDYIFKNFREDIALEKAAALVFMNTSSFSRYFKRHTGKSFTDFIVEIRISNACKMLIEGDDPVAHILYECGFRNQSHFNLFFKKKIGMTPLEYRKSHLLNLAETLSPAHPVI